MPRKSQAAPAHPGAVLLFAARPEQTNRQRFKQHYARARECGQPAWKLTAKFADSSSRTGTALILITESAGRSVPRPTMHRQSTGAAEIEADVHLNTMSGTTDGLETATRRGRMLKPSDRRRTAPLLSGPTAPDDAVFLQ